VCVCILRIASFVFFCSISTVVSSSVAQQLVQHSLNGRKHTTIFLSSGGSNLRYNFKWCILLWPVAGMVAISDGWSG
jgi:hypothetical protein